MVRQSKDADLIDANEIISIREAAEILGVWETRVRRIMQEGRLGRKTAVGWVVTRSECEAFEPMPVGNPDWRRKAKG